MKVLWLCNLVLQDYADEFGISKSYFGGWISGMLSAMEGSDYEIALCFPIIDKNRLKDGEKNNHKYYTFWCDYRAEDYNCESGERMTNRFMDILSDYKPDVIHIWGTEYIHSYSMAVAAENLGMLSKVVVHIQGLVSVCAEYYYQGVPDEIVSQRTDEYPSILDQYISFKNRGEWERKLIKKVRNVLGRTEWDYAHIISNNSSINYYRCGEILRKEYYSALAWKSDEAIPHTIFMTQGTYPLKGVHYVLKALRLLKEKHPDVMLYIAGENVLNKDNQTPYARYLGDLIRKYDLYNNVEYTGWLNTEEMIDRFKQYSVYILPSTIENSPNSLCEAMMIGTPVVSSYVGGIPTIIRNETEGLLYQCNDPEMMAWQIERAFSIKGNNHVFCSKERERAMVFNSIKESRSNLTKAYKEINDANGYR